MRNLILIFLLYPFFLLQAGDYTISGIVMDSTENKGLSNAFVMLKNLDRAVTSSENGQFNFSHLQEGRYSLLVSMVGYKTKKITINLPKNQDSIIIPLTPSVVDMESVVITGTSTEKRRSESPVYTQIIIPEKLIKIGITSVGAALEREVPGLNMDYSQNPLRPAISFQGMNARYVLILVDGERIAGEKNGSIDIARLNMSNVERIEVVRGSSSVLYGSEAIGGVINIITKRPLCPLNMNLFSKYSSFNTMESGMNIAFRNKLIASATDMVFNQSDGYDLNPKAVATTYRTQEKYKNGTVNQLFDLYPSQNFMITADAGAYYERLNNARIRPADSAYSDYNGFVKATYKLSGEQNVSLLYAADDYSTYSILVHANDKQIRSSYDLLQSAKLSTNLNVFSGKLTLGAEHLPEQLYSGSLFATSTPKTATELNGFAQYDYNFNQIVSVIGGLRATQHSAYGFHAVPKVSVMTKTDPVICTLSYGYGYRSPSLKELYYYFDHFGMFTLLGNPALKPEASHYTGLSVEYNKAWWNQLVYAYYNHITNLITDNWIDSKTIQYINDASASILGMDIMERCMLLRNLNLSFGISLVDARNDSTKKTLYSISPISATLACSYAFSVFYKRTTIGISGKYNGHRDYEPIDNIPLYDNPYSLWKADISLQMNKYINIASGVDNIFNTVNTKSYDNISPGRRYFIQLGFALSK